MKALIVSQHSGLMSAVLEHDVLEKSKYVWEDTGEEIKYPLPLNCRRRRKYISPVVKYKYTFDELCNMFPKSVKEIDKNYSASWGQGIYVKGEDGYAECYSSYWDSSD